MSISLINVYVNIQTTNRQAWKTPSCICSCQLSFKSEICCGSCCKLRRVAGEARNMTENAFSILIIFSVQLQQTEISERKLFIFHLGCASIGVSASASAQPPIASGIATMPQGSAITLQKLAMTKQGSSILPRMWPHAKLRPEWRLEWLCSWKTNSRGGHVYATVHVRHLHAWMLVLCYTRSNCLLF